VHLSAICIKKLQFKIHPHIVLYNFVLHITTESDGENSLPGDVFLRQFSDTTCFLAVIVCLAAAWQNEDEYIIKVID